MKRLIGLILTAAVWAGMAPEVAQAQPSRSMPGTRPYLPGSPPINPTPLNPRTRAAASAVGVESTDFYGKKGYPKVLGDAVESQTTGGASAASTGAAGTNTGVSGVQSAGSSGFQGNTGNQIGQNGGGTVLGGLFGGGGGQFANGFNNKAPGEGMTGGAFTGMVPKGFGFGGTPEVSRTWTTPLHGATGK
jgi:hypothetical protein